MAIAPVKQSYFTYLTSTSCQDLIKEFGARCEVYDNSEKKVKMLQVVNYLMIGKKPQRNRQILLLAIKCGKVDIVDEIFTTFGLRIEKYFMTCLVRSPLVSEDVDTHKMTPLMAAACEGHLSIVKYLVERGAWVNRVSREGFSAILLACIGLYTDIIEYLVEQGADINRPSFKSLTCLVYSLRDPKICEYLLKRGANVNVILNNGDSVLQCAIRHHWNSSIKLLLDYGMDPIAKDRNGNDAFSTCYLTPSASRDPYRLEVFDILIDYFLKMKTIPRLLLATGCEMIGANLIAYDSNISRAVTYWKKAIEMRRDNEGGYLKKHANKDQVPFSPFRDVTEFSTEKDFNPMFVDANLFRVQSVLVYERVLGSTNKNTINMLTYLVTKMNDFDDLQHSQYKIDFNVRKCCLHFVYQQFNRQALNSANITVVIVYLIGLLDNYGTEDEIVGFDKVVNIVEVLHWLFERMPNVIYKPRKDFTTQYVANMFIHLFHLLTMLHKTRKQEKMLENLVSRAVMLKIPHPKKSSLLHLAVTGGAYWTYRTLSFTNVSFQPSPEMVHLLVKCGEDPNVINDQKETPLHCAANDGRLEVAQALLDNGAHIDAVDIFGHRADKFLQGTDGYNELDYITLQCLAAQSIAQHNVQYVDIVPKSIARFIKMH